MKFKIMSLNIERYYADWPKRFEKIINFVKQENPDIVFFQEVFDDSRYNAKGNNQLQQLNKELEFAYDSFHIVEQVTIEHQQRITSNVFDGLACLSKFPIVQSQQIILNKESGDSHTRAIQKITIKLQLKTLTFMHVHFSNRDDWARLHLRETLSFIKNEAHTPIIVGDLNIKNIDDLKEISGALYNNSFDFKQYISFPAKNETLDYVLLPKSKYKFVSVNSSYAELSDHNPLLVEIDVLDTL